MASDGDVEIITLSQTITELTRELCTVFVQPHSCLPDWTPNILGFININGKRVWNSAGVRGVTTLVLDPYTGTLSNINHFNTMDTVNGEKMASYIDGVADGTVLLGVTYDEPSGGLGPAYTTLSNAGVFVSDVGIRGNFAFVMQKGYPDKTQMIKSLNNSEVNWLNVSITGGDTANSINFAVGPRVSCNVFIQPQGFYGSTAIPDLQAFVNVAKKRAITATFHSGFPQRRGINLMVLDPCTGTTSVHTQFDTCGDATANDAFVKWVTNFPSGQIMIGLTHDEPVGALKASGKQALAALGVNIADVQIRGNFGFVAQKGYSDKTLFVKGLSPAEANFLDVNITGNQCKSLKFEYSSDAVSTVRVDAASFAADGSLLSAVSINNKRVWVSSAQPSRGINIMYLDPSSGTVYAVANFDTCGSTDAANKLAATINDTPKGAIVIGVTYDEPTAALTDSAKQALASLGVSTAGVPNRGRFAFVAQKGYPDRTQLVKSTDSIGVSTLSTVVSGATSPSVTISSA